MRTGQIIQAYHLATRRLLLLDYDGVLTPIVARPELARPSHETKELLRQLSSDPQNTCVIVSGRNHEELEAWLGDLPLLFVAEHGLWQKDSAAWTLTTDVSTAWKPEVRRLFATYVAALPGALIEEKYAALAFHYRGADQTKVLPVVERLEAELLPLLGTQLMMLAGKKVIEVLPKGVAKGDSVRQWCERQAWSFILVAGDDMTDESMFAAVPPEAYSVKVGGGETKARLSVNSQPAFMELLKQCVQKG